MNARYGHDEEAMALESKRDGNKESRATGDIFSRYAPPFDLTSDLLFVFALCPAAPLRRTFPDIPFLSLLERIPLVIWFSRITQMCYHDTAGTQHCIGDTTRGLYNELNVVALLRRHALFVPGIYATSELTIQVGHRYGMPKQATVMRVQVVGKQFRSEMSNGTQQSFVWARLFGSGKGLAKIISHFLPRWSWPIRFPGGSSIRTLIQATPRVQMVHVQAGQLALEAQWLQEIVALLPVGFYLPAQRMQLPPP